MNHFTKIMMAGALTLLPLQSFAADAAAPATGPDDGIKHSEYWQQLDTNHDGVVSHDEFMAGAERRFKELDTNGDGKIDASEMKAHHEKMKTQFEEKKAAREAKKAAQDAAAKDSTPAAKQ